jgi:hypothetical protein
LISSHSSTLWCWRAYVTLGYEQRSTARELIDAADAQWVLWPYVFFQCTTDAFRTKHQLPSGHSRRLPEDWPNLGSDWQQIWEGTCSTGRVCVYELQNGDGALLCKAPDDDTHLWELHSRNHEVLKKIAEDI